MSYTRSCSNCPYGSSSDPCSDWCDSCQSEPDVGFGGFTDNSYRDARDNPVHFNSKRESDRFYASQNPTSYSRRSKPGYIGFGSSSRARPSSASASNKPVSMRFVGNGKVFTTPRAALHAELSRIIDDFAMPGSMWD